MKTLRPSILLEAILTLACAGLVLAQTSAGSIRGAVTDPTGSVLPNASVTVKNLDTNSERKSTTNDEGLYNADNLLPGDYEVGVEVRGFQRFFRRVTVLTGNTHTVDFSLTVGARYSHAIFHSDDFWRPARGRQ
jgi:hypothetical protein